MAIRTAAFTCDNNLLAVGSDDKRIYVYDIMCMKRIYVYKCGERQRPSHLNGLGSCMFIALHTNHEMVMPLMFLNFPRSFCHNILAANFACSH